MRGCCVFIGEVQNPASAVSSRMALIGSLTSTCTISLLPAPSWPFQQFL